METPNFSEFPYTLTDFQIVEWLERGGAIRCDCPEYKDQTFTKDDRIPHTMWVCRWSLVDPPEISKCYFCHEGEACVKRNNVSQLWWVKCKHCGARTRGLSSEIEVILQWNEMNSAWRLLHGLAGGIPGDLHTALKEGTADSRDLVEELRPPKENWSKVLIRGIPYYIPYWSDSNTNDMVSKAPLPSPDLVEVLVRADELKWEEEKSTTANYRAGYLGIQSRWFADPSEAVGNLYQRIITEKGSEFRQRFDLSESDQIVLDLHNHQILVIYK